MQIPIELDRTLPQPLAEQLADRLRALLQQGQIPAGARLPSSRALADQLGVARNTVVRAYELLTMESALESRASSGFFAAEARRAAPTRTRPGETAGLGLASPAPTRVPEPFRSIPRHGFVAQRLLYDFAPGRPDAETFPVKAWRRLLQSCLSYGATSGMADVGDPGGLAALRAAIAAHLSLNRGILADPAQIVIVGGVQEGLSLVARLFVKPGTRVALEDPCYRRAAEVFLAAGAELVGIPVDEDGLVTEHLPDSAASLVYLTPAHQYPTGATLSLARRELAIQWARFHGAYLVEDDYASEFRYDGSPLQALAGMAPDCTIHLGSFSTTLGAGLRLGYAVVPPQLVDAMRAEKALQSSGTGWLEQAVLAQFLRSGSYAAHLTRCRAQYKPSRDALLDALRRFFGSVDVSGEAAGLHVIWRLPAGVPEAARLEQLARQESVGVYAFASAYVHEISPTSVGARSLLLGYAPLSARQIEQGILRLSDVVDDRLDDFPEFVSELLIDEPPPQRPRSRRPSRSALRGSLRPQPAIRTVSRQRAADALKHEDPFPMRMVRGIYRYPIKGLSPQAVRGVELEAEKPFPFDRVFALARPAVGVSVEAPVWAKKGLFLMLMLDESLAEVRSFVDSETLELTIVSGQEKADGQAELLLHADLKTQAGRTAVEKFFRKRVARLSADPQLVHAPKGHFMDKPDNVISCINLATLRSLEADWGTPLHPLRFRANFYIDTPKPWEEFDWVGSDIQLGDVLFRVDRKNGRCSATNVNPVTGARDLDIPGELRKRFGHKDLGVYLVAQRGGKVVVGDRVIVPDVAAGEDRQGTFEVPLDGSFICRGCYYVYVQANGTSSVPAGTSFAAVPDDFACPDCGTNKASFRPYLAELGADSSAARRSPEHVP